MSLIMRTLGLAAFSYISLAVAEDAIVHHRVSMGSATLENLAVEIEVAGDDDLDATCTLRYRKTGSAEWLAGEPLHRVPAGQSRGTSKSFSWKSKFSGSVFSLLPGTGYELVLQLTDPDGGGGEQLVSASTRAEPLPASDALTVKGGPGDLKKVKPGTVMLLLDGDYGAAVFQKDGEPGAPIVYRSLTGRAVFSEVSLTGRKWVHLEGVTVNGPVRINGTERCVIQRCNIRSQYGIKAYAPGMREALIQDCTITGIQPWQADKMGAGGDNAGEGIQFTGSGNVIRFNRVEGFRDCVSFMEDDGAVEQSCNDIHDNDILVGLDDGIEADFAAHNCRIYRNRVTNCFVGISSQPGLGGPNYFRQNVLFNIAHEAFKLHRFSQGDRIERNTVVKAGDGLGIYTSEPFDHAIIQRNVFVAGPAPEGMSYGGYAASRGRVVDVQHFGPNCIMDQNVYCVQDRSFEGKIGSWTFTKLPGKKQETHGRQVDWSSFPGASFPTDPLKLYAPESIHFPAALPEAGAEVLLHYGPRK